MVYDIYRRCLTAGPSINKTELLGPTHGEVMIGDELKTYRRHYSAKDFTPWLYKYDGLRASLGLEEDPLGPCTFGLPMLEWTNSPKIRELLHIPNYAPAWEACTNSVGYTSGKKASEWIYRELKGKYRILFYSGDTDGAVPTHGS